MPTPTGTLLSRISKILGLATVRRSSRDAKVLFLQRFTRRFAYGATYVILVHFLSNLSISDEHIGLFMTLTMLGDAAISFVLTLITDQVGRRKVLSVGAILMTSSRNEIGPFRAVEESILAQLTDKNDRSDIFVWYAMCGTAGAALGTLTSGWAIQLLQNISSWKNSKAYRFVFILYAALGIVKLVLNLMLSPDVELERKDHACQEDMELENESLLSDDSSTPKNAAVPQPTTLRSVIRNKFLSLLPQISSKSITILVRLIFLFALDSSASGLASPSWLTYFFTIYHGIPPSALGTLFFIANTLATISNFAALPLARRIGPLKTMTFTHLPSTIFLGLIPLPPATEAGTWMAMVFLGLRACTSSMDQAPRQAFLAAVVTKQERTAVMGAVNVVKTLAQAGGLGTAGVLAKRKWWFGLFGGAGLMKATYDLLILWTFLGLRDRDEEDDGNGR